MTKYIIKESELRSLIKEIIKEELSLNEGLTKALGNALLNTARYGALTVVAPSVMAQKIAKKESDIVNGSDSIGKTVKDFFGGEDIKSSGSASKASSGSKNRKTRAERQKEKLMNTKSISYEYGRPETTPRLGRRDRLAPKSEVTAPSSENGVEWGSFGRHYHDEGDRAWNRKVTDYEKSFLRNSQGRNEAQVARLQRRYKRRLVDWLKDRDRDYEIYIKNQ